MQAFDRKVGESILVGTKIRVTVIGLREGVARLGVTAPSGTAVLRGELSSPAPRSRKTKPRCQRVRMGLRVTP